MVALGATDVQTEDDLAGNTRPLPGRYHAIVKEVDESMEKFDKVIVEFEALSGTTPGQEGRCVTEFFAITDKALVRLKRLAIVLGLLKPGEPEKDIAFADGVGQQLVIEVEENRYEKDGKTIDGVRVGFLGFWSMGNPAVADVPKCADGESLAGKDAKQSSPTEAAPTQEPVAAAASSKSDDKWANL